MGLFSSKEPQSARADQLIVWGRANSVNVQKPLWILGELETAFEREEAGGPFGRLDSPEFRALSPLGLIPVVVDRRFGAPIVVWESAAILRHLADAARRLGHPLGETLWPDDVAARAHIDRWAEWAQVNWYPPIRDLFNALIRTPVPNRDIDAIRQIAEDAHAAARIAESALAESGGYLAGPELTLADFPFAALLHRYMTLEIKRPELPALSAYYERLKGRPAYAAVVAVHYDDMRFPGSERSATPVV